MKNEKGITLVSLVITIVVLIILASITTYAGLNSIRTSKLTRFKQELELMQSQVNLLYEKYKDEETITIGKDISQADSTKVENAFNSIGSQVTQADYRYFDVDTERFELVTQTEFEGSSHKKITKKVYVR